MHGVNARPLPTGDVKVRPNGAATLKASGGRQYELRPNGSVASLNVHGHTANFRPDGRIAAIHSDKLAIRHNLNGASVVVSHRGNMTLVSTGPRAGFMERHVTVAGRPFVARTYVVNHSTYTRVYAPYNYHGLALEHYVPRFYYAPAFYGYAYYPWAAPVSYRWGWMGDPWYSAYNGYFSPYPAYAAPYAWVADYYLSQTLANAYQPQPEGLGGENFVASADQLQSQTDAPITPALKAEIADQVRQQIELENAIATGAQPAEVAELPAALKANRVFVVASDLDVTTTDQQTCAVSAGDVLRLDAAPTAEEVIVNLHVASSRRADCPAGTQISLSLQDLQDMQNSLRANVDSGLEALRANQGQGGLPPAPQDAIAPPPRPSMAGLPTDGNDNVASLLDAQRRDAAKAEQEVMKAAGQ